MQRATPHRGSGMRGAKKLCGRGCIEVPEHPRRCWRLTRRSVSGDRWPHLAVHSRVASGSSPPAPVAGLSAASFSRLHMWPLTKVGSSALLSPRARIYWYTRRLGAMP